MDGYAVTAKSRYLAEPPGCARTAADLPDEFVVEVTKPLAGGTMVRTRSADVSRLNNPPLAQDLINDRLEIIAHREIEVPSRRESAAFAE